MAAAIEQGHTVRQCFFQGAGVITATDTENLSTWQRVANETGAELLLCSQAVEEHKVGVVVKFEREEGGSFDATSHSSAGVEVRIHKTPPPTALGRLLFARLRLGVGGTVRLADRLHDLCEPARGGRNDISAVLFVPGTRRRVAEPSRPTSPVNIKRDRHRHLRLSDATR